MRTDLSDIAKHLILLLRDKSAALNFDELREQLPDADFQWIVAELMMLWRSRVVRRGVDTKTGRVVYWLNDVNPNRHIQEEVDPLLPRPQEDHHV
ncbi:hypothetical protein BGLT_06788 [Caballeronia glathei]|uniref:ArsR family transcriptional regulator n=1 Tax=Caballeronia glathei TaxID=60547 RepID=A0A069PLB8_9BURK|nr:hypothetical protein [Caballeronia glathei]KDR41177.1 hypothetical protein BG61_20820 [Caballeronia glathei]CDY77982.1 hypothetical protein BGLT_06788 [Caballeronia glathei]